MKFGSGEIYIFPKIIHFIEIPYIINDDDKLDLLRKDILLIEQKGELNTLHNLAKNESGNSAYFYDLENIFLRNRIKKEDYFSFAANMATFIKNFIPERSLVYTSTVNEKIAYLFRSEGIPYIEKNLSDKKMFFYTILNIVKPFFIDNQRLMRSALRFQFLPMKYKIEIINLSAKNKSIISGYLKDINLYGLCFVLNNSFEKNLFSLKDKLQLRLFLPRNLIKIGISFVTRISSDKNEIGVSYNISDSHMISVDDANKLTSIFYIWLKEIIVKLGMPGLN